MDTEREIQIAQTIIDEAIEKDKSPYVQVSMGWKWDTTLRDIIDFNDQLRGIGYKTTYEIYGDEGRTPHVIATFTKLE